MTDWNDAFEANTAPTEALEPFDEHNRRLLEAVHPPQWTNPRPEGRYHLVVLGAGTAGLVAAGIASSLGASVALVERELMGGDCLNVGCVPSKGVIAASRAWAEARRAAERFGGPPVADGAVGDFAAAMERMRRIRADISPIDGARRFRDDFGVDVHLGHARFVAGDAVEVGGQRLEFKKAIIATGARAALPPIDGLAQAGALTNETVFSLTELPRRFGVIGGGPIGCELGQSFARFGSEVVLFQAGDQLLSREDSDAAALVAASLRRDGVDVRLGAKVVRVETRQGERGTERVLTVESDGETTEHVVDELLVAVGRAPNVENLGLEAAGVEYDGKGIDVDDHLQTSSSSIYAIGDVASQIKLTHLSDAHARMAVRNALFFGRQSAGDLVVPWCTYTSPEVAHVGRYADEARKAGFAVETITLQLEENDRARLEGETEGFLRLHLEEGSDRILGGTLVAERAGDMIGILSLAITHEIGLGKFSETIFPYPTQGEVFKRAGDQYNRRKLTPTVEKLFDWRFKLLD